MKIYKANFSANNGTRLMNNLTGTNKEELNKKVRDLALAERFEGNSCQWAVWHGKDEDENYDYLGRYTPGVGLRYIFKNGKPMR